VRSSSPRWVGVHVVWWGGGDSQFTHCVRCGKPLRSALAVKNGYGPGCANELGIASLVRKTLSEERERARRAIADKAPVAPHNRRTRRELSAKARAPSPKQMHCLRSLAQRTGRTFVMPRNSQDASREISRLKAAQKPR
jgi:hypothetical protein